MAGDAAQSVEAWRDRRDGGGPRGLHLEAIPIIGR